MKSNILMIICILLILVIPGFSMADQVKQGHNSGKKNEQNLEPDYPEFTDIIYEWTPGGRMIQVGNRTISRIDSVWIDKGNNTLKKTGKWSLKVGKPARVILLGNDKSGFWQAHKIIVFSGKGMKTALKLLPKSQR